MNKKENQKLDSLLEDISRLYVKFGIKSVTMDDVAHELGISKKTLYQYFSDKNDLVRKVIQYHTSKHTKMFTENLKKKSNSIDILLDASKQLINFLETFNPSIRFDLQKYYPDILKILTEHRQNHVFENIKENILKGMKDGLYRKDLNPDIIATLYVSRLDVLFDSENLPNKEYTFSVLFDEMFKYHIRGIASKKGIEYYESKIKNCT